MALSGTISNSFHGGLFTVSVEWTATQNISNNTSTVTAKMYLKSNGPIVTISSSASKTAKITIAGTTYSSSVNISVSGNQKKLLTTKTKTITHNASGTKSFSISGNLALHVTLTGTKYTTVSISSKSFTLNTIPRVSSFTLSRSTRNFGQAVTINISKATSSFTHTVRYSLGGRTETIHSKTSSSSPSWTIPTSLMTAIPNSTSVKGTIYVDTYSGSTKIGTKSRTITVNVPTSVVPTMGALTVSEANTIVANSSVTGFVQGLSRLRMTVASPSGASGSTIKSYKWTVDKRSYTSRTSTSNTITGSGTLSVQLVITDSRGRTATKSTNITVTSYTSPKINTFKVERANSDGSLNAVGTHAKITATGSWSSLSNSNKASITIVSTPRGSTTKTTLDSKTNQTGSTYTYSAGVKSGFEADKSYDVEITIKDQFKTTRKLINLVTGKVPMSWGREGVGIGKVWERGALDIAGDMYMQIEGTSGRLEFVSHPTLNELQIAQVFDEETYSYLWYRKDRVGFADARKDRGIWRQDLETDTFDIYSQKVKLSGDLEVGNIASGQVTVPGGSGTRNYVDVSFGKTFSSAPQVAIAPNTTVMGSLVEGVGIGRVTTTGFTVNVLRSNSTGTIVRWIAVGRGI